MSKTLPSNLLAKLKEILGDKRVCQDTFTLESFGTDRNPTYPANASTIVFPESTEQSQAVVKLAYENNIPLVPSGGRTGLNGGATATDNEVVISFDRMNAISNFNSVDQTVNCQAGVITRQLQDFASNHDLFYPVNFGSAGSSQIGGNISTNAGGIKVIRYGSTRNWIAGLKVVTGKGDILELNNGLMKNSTGYDLRHLFIGAEGTLGLITEATIRLTQPPANLQVMVVGIPEMSMVMPVLENFKNHLELTAFEFFSEKVLLKVIEHVNHPRPFEKIVDYYALIEFNSTSEDILGLAMTAFEECQNNGWIVEGVVSQSEQQHQQLWRLREDITESIAPYSPHKNDVSVNISDVPAFLDDLEKLVFNTYPHFEVVWFGHIGDGNLHLNVLKPKDMDNNVFHHQCHKVDELVYDIVEKYHGSISAEHGIGLVKRNYLGYSHSAQEIDYMKGLKSVFDPKNIMNPGKIFSL
ncbi:FAD-binding oxidoreductase [Pseudomonadota bacterium]